MSWLCTIWCNQFHCILNISQNYYPNILVTLRSNQVKAWERVSLVVVLVEIPFQQVLEVVAVNTKHNTLSSNQSCVCISKKMAVNLNIWFFKERMWNSYWKYPNNGRTIRPRTNAAKRMTREHCISLYIWYWLSQILRTGILLTIKLWIQA